MNPENSNNGAPEPAEHGLEFDDEKEVTQVRRRIQKVDTYPPRPERTMQVDHYPTKNLERVIEPQIDQWSERRMLKTAIALGNDETKAAVIESLLNQCQTAGKIHKFESNSDGGITTFTVYYRYTNA